MTSSPSRKIDLPDPRTRSVSPVLSEYEPALLGAKYSTPDELAFCPNCKTLAYLFHPPSAEISKFISESQAFGHIAGSEVQQSTLCELCLLASRAEDRRVAVLAGLLWFIILAPESTLTQAGLNQYLWGVVRAGDSEWATREGESPSPVFNGASRNRRLAAREQLLAKLAITPETRTAFMPHEVFTEPEAALVERYIRDKTGQFDYHNLSNEDRHALYASIGVDLLLREQRPLWRERVLFFLTDIGVEALATEPRPLISVHALGA